MGIYQQVDLPGIYPSLVRDDDVCVRYSKVSDKYVLNYLIIIINLMIIIRAISSELA